MKTCTYKGKRYEMTWSGTTKFGEKAKLKFLNSDDPAHEGFWAKLEDVSDIREGGDITEERPKASGKAATPVVGEPCPTCGRTVLPADDSEIPF